mmetsp:Transcript_18002/g.72142  ORF Transcript_18002/g.72142 Transcript_18002/m.72142 type:complete len:491 (+) Transcript_18002:107-1579(+)
MAPLVASTPVGGDEAADEETRPLLRPRPRSSRRTAIAVVAGTSLGLLALCARPPGTSVTASSALREDASAAAAATSSPAQETTPRADRKVLFENLYAHSEWRCAYNAEIRGALCPFVPLAGRADVGVEVYLPEDAKAVVVYAPGSGWCGTEYTKQTAAPPRDQATTAPWGMRAFPCDALVEAGYGCVIAYYGAGSYPAQHRNFLDEVAWVRDALGEKKTTTTPQERGGGGGPTDGGFFPVVLFGISSGSGLVAYAWATLAAQHDDDDRTAPIAAAVMFSASVYLPPVDAPTCAASTCPVTWANAAAPEQSYAYSNSCDAEVGTRGCELAYTNASAATADALLEPFAALVAAASDNTPPAGSAGKVTPAPVYVSVGEVDPCVQCCNSVQLHDWAKRAGVDNAVLRVVPNGGHGSYWVPHTGDPAASDHAALDFPGAPPILWSDRSWWKDELHRAVAFVDDIVVVGRKASAEDDSSEDEPAASWRPSFSDRP